MNEEPNEVVGPCVQLQKTQDVETKRPNKLFFIGEKEQNFHRFPKAFEGGSGRQDNGKEKRDTTEPNKPFPGLSSDNGVDLPPRYRDDVTHDLVSDKMVDRERDLDVALKWLRQEILCLKEQDRLLMRQLLSLRATIHQLHGFRSCRSFGSSLATLGMRSGDAFAFPGEYGALSGPCTLVSPVSRRDLAAGFQNRTVSMISMTRGSPNQVQHLAQFGHSQEFFL